MFSVEEIYEYSTRVRRKFLESLGALPWEEATKDREASFHSMKNIFIHMIEVEDWMVSWVIPGRADPYKWDKFDEYTTPEEITAFLDRVESNTRQYLEVSDEKELSRRVTLTLRSGDAFQLSPEECIFQAVTEQLYHVGELIALLWQQEVRPPRMQWFWNNPRVSQLPETRR
jgi:uncharacterized damage-inducible protein DinB